MNRVRIDIRQRRLIVSAGLCVLALLLLCVATAGAARAAAPAWLPVGVSGPTVLPPRQSEVQRIFVDAEGGTFTLTARELVASGVGDVGGASGTEKTVTRLTTSTGAFAVGQVIEGFGIPTGTTITGTSPLTLSQIPTQKESGVALSAYASPVTTTSIPFDASPTEVQGALEALAPIGVGNVEVSGGPGAAGAEAPYVLVFKGALAGANVSQLVADSSSLSGNASVQTTVPGGPGTSVLSLMVQNVGGATGAGVLTYRVILPSGITAISAPLGAPGEGPEPGSWECGGSTSSEVLCTLQNRVRPGLTAPPIAVTVTAAPGTGSGTINLEVEESGAGEPPATTELPLTVNSTPAGPGIQSFAAGAFDANGLPDQGAGDHPYSADSAIFANTVRSIKGALIPVADLKDLTVSLPPGFLGNPTATEVCPASTPVRQCPPETVVGTIEPGIAHFGEFNKVPVVNSQAPLGAPAEFRFRVQEAVDLNIIGTLRSDEDYGIDTASLRTPQVLQLFGVFVSLWGEPAASSHDSARCEPSKTGIQLGTNCQASTAPDNAFLTSPTDCQEQGSVAAADGGLVPIRLASTYWEDPGVEAFDRAGVPPVTGCGALTEAWLGPKKPTFSFQPTSSEAASPTAATASLHVPQTGLLEPDGLATADLKKTVVTLPQGLSLNPAAANGLEACTEAQIGFIGTGFPMPNPIRFNEAAPACPKASKLGTLNVKTPLLEEELEGTVYLAAQEENPFHSLLALYLVVDDAKTGVVLKLPGELHSDPTTGRLTATFDDNPQLPFEDLTLHFRGGGPRSQLATPEVCGSYKTTGSLTPWSAETESPSEAAQIEEPGFQITSGPGGGTCATSEAGQPFSPTFEAGTTSTQAGAYAPLVVKIARKDGEQELKRLEFTLPKGLTGKLAGIPYCPDSAIAAAETKSGKAEQASPSCPAASRLGSVDTSAGVGSEPIYVSGSIYLAGPYEGAPLSSVVITPAVAGPFDLGDVVVRAPLFVNPETAQITAKSDPIPSILKGISLKLRSVTINVDRSGFILNPTSCEPMTLTASLSGSSGGSASPSNRFQVGNCGALAFRPKIQISLKGSTKHTGHPALKAVVTYPQGSAYANIGRAQVNLPPSEFIDQGNLNKTCTKPVLLEGKCPASTIYGKATAWTPLLEAPLSGNVYLVGGYGYKLPALVADLNGQIRALLVGKVDSGKNKGIRNTFEAVPDAPVEKFILEMKGGKKYSLLENSEDLCQKPQKAIARFTAQNGVVKQWKPVVENECRKGKKPKKTTKRLNIGW